MTGYPDYIKQMLPDASNEEILSKINESLPLYPKDRDILLYLKSVYNYYVKNLEENVLFCKEVLDTVSDKENRHGILAYLFFSLRDLKRIPEAITVKIQEMEETEDWRTGEDIAPLFEEIGDTDNAIKYYLIAAPEADYDVHQKLAERYEAKKEYKNAAFWYESAARMLNGEAEWLWCGAGRMYYYMEDKKEAEFIFRMVIKLDPEFADAYYYLGVLYEEAGDIYRALHNFYQALKFEPNFPEVYNNLGAIAFNEDSDIQKAIEWMLIALEKKPSENLEMTIYMNLRKLYKKIADYDMEDYYLTKYMNMLGFDMEKDDDGEDDDNDDLTKI